MKTWTQQSWMRALNLTMGPPGSPAIPSSPSTLGPDTAVGIFPESPEDASIRRVAGRLFVLEEGVWKDTSATPDGRMIRIEPYSRSYLDLPRALPEVRSWWSALEQVHLAAGELVLALEPNGSEQLAESEIRRIADEFLQDESTRP